MGKQVRKVMPWTAMVESHLVTGHVVHRMYRWSTYFSHPTMRPGSPFKYRGSSTPYVGMLSTPDVLKYKIPVPFAFVPANPYYNPRKENASQVPSKKNELISSSEFQYSADCQKTIQNYNKCLRNNKNDGVEACVYYLNYLNLNCRK